MSYIINQHDTKNISAQIMSAKHVNFSRVLCLYNFQTNISHSEVKIEIAKGLRKDERMIWERRGGPLDGRVANSKGKQGKRDTSNLTKLTLGQARERRGPPSFLLCQDGRERAWSECKCCVGVNCVLFRISYSCLLSDGSRKGWGGKSRAKSGQSWINWNVHRPCEAFVKNILKYIEYIDRPCEDSAKINYKKTIILIWHISDLFWVEHRGHNLASWLLPNQSDHSTRAKVLHPPHAGEEQKIYFLCDVQKYFS